MHRPPHLLQAGRSTVRVTAIVDGGVWYACTDEELTNLLHAVFAAPHRGWAATLAAWYAPPQDPRPDDIPIPDHRLRVVTDWQDGWMPAGWAALNFLRQSASGHSWDGWDAYNAEVSAEAPALPFGTGGLWFPASSSFPEATIRSAVHEYCHTGRCPTAVNWQPARYF